MEINKDLNYSKNLFDNYFHTFIIAEQAQIGNVVVMKKI